MALKDKLKLFSNNSKNKRVFIIISIALIIFIFCSSLFLLGFFQNVNQKLSDNLYGQSTHLDNIIIIAIDDESLEQIGIWPWNRNNFSLLLNQLTDAQVIAFDISFFKDAEGDEQFQQSLKQLNEKNIPLVFGFEYLKLKQIDNQIKGFEPSHTISKFTNNNSQGYVNVLSDDDGLIRKIPLNLSNENYSALSAEVYKIIKGFDHKRITLNINYVGPANTFKYYSFKDVIAQKYSSDEFKNKIVFIGASAQTLNDNHFVPTSKGMAMPGVEIHANALNTMLTKTYIETEAPIYVVFSILVSTILIALLIMYFKPKITIISSIIFLIIYFFLAINLFSQGIILNLIYVPITIIISIISFNLIAYIFEKQHKQQVIGAFEKYVSKDVVKEIIQNPTQIKFGGEKKKLTILFTDIRDFTSISESMTPEDLVKMLNDYLSSMTNIIMENRGLVDKFIGDAIMAFWGAPLDNSNSEKDACITALAMTESLHDFNKTKNLNIKIGIGINSGEAVVGNLGSKQRFDYTAIGDDVNTASRYEGLTKQYGIGILVGEKTYERVKNEFLFREVDFVAVKGKKKFTKIYELLKENSQNKKLVKEFSTALEEYRKQNWDEAKKLFEKIEEDMPSEIFMHRCDEFKENPPGKDWKGEYIFKTK